MVDAPPRHVGDVQQAVDAAEIDEGAVFGDVLDHAVDDLALGEALHQLGALLGERVFQHRAAGDDDVAAPLVHLEDAEGLRRVCISGPTSRTGRTSTWLRGRKATAPSRSTVKPPFTWLKIMPVTVSFFSNISSSRTQLSSRRAFSRDSIASPSAFSTRSR